MRLSFDSRVALVTGDSPEICSAVAEALKMSGAAVHITGDGAALGDLASRIGARFHRFDVRDRHDALEAVRFVVETEGRIDVLIHTAATSDPLEGEVPESLDQDSWRSIISSGVETGFWLAQACAPAMKRAGFGRIVLVASPSNGSADAATDTARHALIGVTRRVSADVAPYGVTVNAILPGPIEDAAGPTDQEGGANAQRRGKAADVAAAAVFLASEQAAWINGHALPVDGGGH
ncbi:SDR family NAD(P)-dependent oxidoreductase [Alsobacter sp. R-9]